MKHIKHVKYVLPTDKYISPTTELFTIWKKSHAQTKSTPYTETTLETCRYLPYH